MREMVLWILRMGLAGVFVYAGAMKLSDPAGFAVEIEGYRLVPQVAAAWTALYLPWLEIVVGIGVLLPRWCRGAALLQATMLVVFIGALSTTWWRGLDVSCGCFGGGAGESANYAVAIGRDVVLLGGIFVVIWSSKKDGAHAET